MDFISESNNILAIEYIKELMRINSDIEPFSILRKGAAHNSTESYDEFKSATAIRSDILEINKKLISGAHKFSEEYAAQIERVSDYIPKTTEDVIKRNCMEKFYPLESDEFLDEIVYSIIRNEDSLEDYFEVVEGIENAIKKKATSSYNVNELIESLTTVRYTSSRIRRIIFNILLGVEKRDVMSIRDIKKVPYIRVLAFNRRGTEILKEVKNKSDVMTIKSPAKARKSNEYKNDSIFKKMFDFDIRSSNIYYQKYYRNNRKLLKKGEPDFIKLGYML